MTRYHNHAGWFAEIPRELKEDFCSIYPGRSNIRKFTIACVTWAIRYRPNINTLIEDLEHEYNPKRVGAVGTREGPSGS